jgi:uncharacterized protein (TIGR04255 family)
MSVIRPAKDVHAIDSVVFGVTFDSPLNIGALNAIDTHHSKFKDELPRRSQAHGLTLPFQPPLNVNPQVTMQALGMVPMQTGIVGLMFDSLAPNGNVVRGMSITMNQLEIIRADYKNWSNTWPEIRALLRIVMPICLQNRSIMSVSVVYSDKFFYNGDYSDFRADMILQRGSPYVPPHVFDRKLNWHSHTGWFEDGSAPFQHRLLTHVNIDLLDQDNFSERLVQINLSHTADRINFLGDPISERDDGATPLDALFSHLHSFDKQILSRILNLETCRLIDLDVP